MNQESDLLCYDFKKCKFCNKSSSVAKYKIHSGIRIFVCSSCGAHYIGHLDNISWENEGQFKREKPLSKEEFDYIDKQLQSNVKRFESKAELVKRYTRPERIKILDVGAGGGLFLHLMHKQGAEVFGIEPNPIRVQFAHQKYGLKLCEFTLEHPYWQSNFREFFDAVTMWDLIEHVNYPVQLLEEARSLLKKRGLLCVDTPARDAFYYRFGELTYFITRGRYPTFLSTLYSNERFAHKQILSSEQLIKLVRRFGFEPILFKKFHELSFPYSFYLRHFFKSQAITKILEPFVASLFYLIRIKNKMLLVARKHR